MNPEPSDRRYNAFPTKPLASQGAVMIQSELIGIYNIIYTRQKRLASYVTSALAKGGQGSARFQISY